MEILVPVQVICSKRALLKWAASCALLASAMPAYAQETTSYTYDALGRLVVVSHPNGPNSGTNATYTYDAASNRTNVTVAAGQSTGSGSGSGSGSGVSAQTKLFVVLPINGYTVVAYNPAGNP